MPGDVFELGGATVEVLGPLWYSNNTNDLSLIMCITYGDVSFLFTGDAEWDEEHDLVEAGIDRNADVLKVGHHGSSTSSSYVFLREVSPEYPYLMDSYFMETGVTGLPGGWYAAPMSANVTFPGRLYLTGDVNLLLTSGSTITCNGGIDVPPGSSLTIWAMPGGAGTLNATAVQFCAGIGGSKSKSNGPITINGGTVNATGYFGAGLGGGDLAAGGTVVINGGTVNATGANGSAGIGDSGGLTLKGCVFDGSLSTGSRTGGFVGWTSGNLTIRDCLFAPASVSSIIYTFYYDDDGTHPAAITNSTCLTDYGTPQGKQAFSVTAGSGVTIDFGAPGTVYGMSGITAYPAGLMYGTTFYAGPGDAVTLGLSAEPWEGHTSFTASAGTLAQTGDAWTLTMPGGDVVISAVVYPAFGTPDFTLPAFLTTVEEEAFEGIAASIVDIPASCTNIGAHAFRNCPNLTQIRIPANCVLGVDVFEGCTMVVVYGMAGSSAEAYCQSHANCVFVPLE